MSLLDQELHLYSQPLSLAEDVSFSKDFLVPASFVGFQGHFPDTPVLPVVIQAIMARMLLQEAHGKKEGELVLAKFLAALGSGKTIRIEGSLRKGKR